MGFVYILVLRLVFILLLFFFALLLHGFSHELLEGHIITLLFGIAFGLKKKKVSNRSRTLDEQDRTFA